MAKSEILLEVGTNELEILEFFIDEKDAKGGYERVFFGMNVAKVMQVIDSPQLKHPDYAQQPSYLGTIPLREHILPVIDLSVWLQIKRKVHDEEFVIVTEFSQAVTGFLVSGVTEILRVGWHEVKPPAAFLTTIPELSLIGTIERSDRLIQLLDMESILSDIDPPPAKTEKELRQIIARHTYPTLVADDSPTILEMVNKNLKAANFAPTLTRNGQEAWNSLCKMRDQAADEGRDIYDFVRIVIADIEMPMLDGFTLTKRIKTDPVLQKIPVILYSSIITDELRHKGISVKADAQVSKPELHKMAEQAISLIEGATPPGTH